MPLSRNVAQIASHRFNPIASRFLLRLPGFGQIVHVGRISGKEYRTPMLVFRRGELITLALTYGPHTDWVQNVLAAGSCTLIQHDRSELLTDPQVLHDPALPNLPRLVRTFLRLLGVEHVLVLHRVTPTDEQSADPL